MITLISKYLSCVIISNFQLHQDIFHPTNVENIQYNRGLEFRFALNSASAEHLYLYLKKGRRLTIV